MEDFNDNVNNEIDALNTVKGRKNNGQFQKGKKRPENAGRKKKGGEHLTAKQENYLNY